MAIKEREIYTTVHRVIRKQDAIQKARKVGVDGLKLSMSLANLYQACSGSYSGVFIYDTSKPSNTVTNEMNTSKKSPLYAIGQPVSVKPMYPTLTLGTIEAAEVEATKIRALEKDLKSLLAIEPAFHAVIFTHLSSTLERVACMARANNIQVFMVKSGISMKQRHDNILKFQTVDGKPKVFISTIRTGNVGINVQSATRVYIMEPSINPAVEIQCAGRIHRLGQLRDVFVRWFCFRDTIEECCFAPRKDRIGCRHHAQRCGSRSRCQVTHKPTGRPTHPTTPTEKKEGVLWL